MRNRLFNVLAVVLFMLMAGSSLYAQKFSYSDAWYKHGFSLESGKGQSVEVSYSVGSFSMDDLTVDGKVLKDLSLPGSLLFNNEGAPDLPGSGKLIAIPQGSSASFQIISSRREVIQDVDLAPAPRIPKDDENVPLQYQKNEAIYGTNAFYPSQPVVLSDNMKIRGVDAVMLGITPFQYNPVTRELIVYRDLKVKITFTGGNGQFGDSRLRSRWWDPILEDALLNLSALPAVDYNRTSSGGPGEETGAEYLIITPTGADFVQWADSIKKFRTEQGILTLVKTLDQVGGNTTTAIETYINNAYNTWTIPPAAILLLGDYGTDASNSVVSPIYDNYCVSDNIYGDVDGDHLPEIVMARITANNAAQLSVMVTKFLNYERNPPTSADFYDHPITALGWQTERWFQICSETVGGFWKNVQGKNPVRINEVYGGNPASDPWSTATNTSTVVSYFGPSGLGYIPSTPQTLGNWTGGNATAINSAINNGAFMLQHRDHGMETGWGEPSYVSSNIDGLVNTDLTYIMSINCLTGKYNYSSECFAEKFHRYTHNGSNSGALGIMAASEVSYSFVNDTYVWGMYDNMWPDFMPAEGTTPESRGVLPAFGNAAGKIFLAQSGWPYNTSNKEVTYNLFHHHGDAFLTVYSEVPQNLTVFHNPVLFAGTTSFSVTADAGSLIALTVNGEIIGTGTGTGSPVNIMIPAQVPPNQVVVTVTKQNYFRYRAVVSVIPAEGPYVVYNTVTVSDPEPGGNNNGYPDYDETLHLSVALRNVGIETATNVVATLSSADAFVTITDNQASYGSIDPDEIVTIPAGYTLVTADNIPDQHVVSFTLSATDGIDTWESNFSLTANAPVPEIGALTVLDNGPGCNNDGILDPGETADLVISCSNTGHSPVANVNATLAIQGGTSAYLTLNSSSFSIGSMASGATAEAIFNVTADASTPLGTPVDLLIDLTGGVNSQYTDQAIRQVVIGLIPEYNMMNGSITACTGYFYDSGGASGEYADSENFTMTINPSTPGSMTRLVFTSFSTESGYDYLRIYNGTSTSATLIGTYNGTSGPGTVTATNASGALTINFTSDGSVTRPGWVAEISCYDLNVPPVADFTASTTAPAVNSTVVFSDISQNAPTSWAWSFSPADVTFVNGSSASSQNPEVLFSNLGTYTVTLTVTNAYGQDTEVKAGYITVSSCTYCTTSYSNLSDDFISNVQLNTLNNPSGSTSYSNFTALSTELTPGTDYPVSVTVTVNGAWIQHCILWVDWNNNCSFADAGEALDLGQTPGTTGVHVLSGNLAVPAGLAPGSYRMRVAERYSVNPEPCTVTTYGEAEDYTLIVAPQTKTLNLTLFLESLYNGDGTMRKAQGTSGDQFPLNIADQITVELHDAVNYAVVHHSEPAVMLSTIGQAEIQLPAEYNGSYYITIRHRNSLETTSKLPVSFAGNQISYSFDGMAQAYGDNMAFYSDGHCAIFCGDVNHDGVVDTGDMSPVDNDAGNYAGGYLDTDVNGDGIVDTGDMTVVDNNAAAYTGSATP